MERIGDKDLNIVRKQLGRNVVNVMRVEKWCSFGFPVVILSYPVRNNSPFPTIHYLTCPHLVKEISRLEEKGLISDFESAISKDENLRTEVEQAHRDVIKKRLSILESYDEKWRPLLSEVGSGGIKDFANVKCLHLHVADYLAGIDNPIGKDVIESIRDRETGENVECQNSFCNRFL
ncbi:MAG: DUF501 domain-containing protein [Fervidobacterium sp.]